MKTLKLDNFRVSALSNLHSVRGGDDDSETGPSICVESSSKWVTPSQAGGGGGNGKISTVIIR